MKTEAIDQIEFRSPELMFQLQSMRQIYDNAAGQVDVAHRHNYHTALLVEKARGKHLIDYNTYNFGIRQVHLVSPGQVHQVIVDAKPKGHVITFSKAFLISNGISLDFINNINLFNAFGNTQPIGLNSEVFSVNESGNITLSGTIDERDLAADGNKLDGISATTTSVTVEGTTFNKYTHPNHTGDVTSTGDGVTSIANYKDGLKHGKTQIFDKKGKMISEKEFKEGVEVVKGGTPGWSPK